MAPSQAKISVVDVNSDQEENLRDKPTTAPTTVKAGRFLKSLLSKDAWFGDYVRTGAIGSPQTEIDAGQDYLSLFIPDVPYLTKRRELPFYGVDDKLPYFLVIVLGLQQ